MNKSMKVIYKAPIYILVILLLLSSTGCRSKKATTMPLMEKAMAMETTEHEIAVVETQTIDTYLYADAMVTYDEYEDLSFKADYLNLKGLYVATNDSVEEGQLLAELDTTDLEYQIDLRELDLQRLQLMVDMIQKDTFMEAADKNTELESLELDKESIELDINHLKDLVTKAKIYAPFSGIVTYVPNIQPGTAVPAYDRFITLWKGDSIMLTSNLPNPEVDLSGIVAGMEVDLIYGSKDTRTEIPAKISKIINTDPGVQDNPNRVLTATPAFQVYVKPDGINTDKLHIYNTVILRIKTGTLENVVVIPDSVIQGFGTEHIVKVVKGDKIINRIVQISYEDKANEIVVVTSGLKPGESILIK